MFVYERERMRMEVCVAVSIYFRSLLSGLANFVADLQFHVPPLLVQCCSSVFTILCCFGIFILTELSRIPFFFKNTYLFI